MGNIPWIACVSFKNNHPDTTKKPKTKKKHLWTELLVSGKSFDSFPGVFLVSLGFLEREFVFFGFRRVASSRNQKNSRKMLALEVSKIQKPKKTIFFCFSASKTKKPNTLSRKPKETKKTPGKPKNQNFSLKPRILFQKIVFWVFGFLVVACLKSPNSKNQKHSRKMLVWEVSKLQKPTRLIEKIVFFDTFALFKENTYK